MKSTPFSVQASPDMCVNFFELNPAYCNTVSGRVTELAMGDSKSPPGLTR